MNSKFFDLKKEKQDRMINAALKVFALQGYRHASTDDIVREADISKGLLFHYFGSKIGVYTFVYDYSVRYMMLELGAVPVAETNLFALVKQVETFRIRAMKGYPYMQQFLNRAMIEDESEALLAIEDKRNTLNQFYESLYGRIDYSTLPTNIDGKKLLNMIDYTIKGLMTERFLDASYHPDMLYEEICSYLDVLEKLVESA